MKRKLTILTLVLISFVAHAQNIAKDSILKVGFYKNVQELIDNSPSIPFDYEIIGRMTFGSNIFKKNIEIFNLIIEENDVEKVGDIFGFCDGNNIYLKTMKTWGLTFSSNAFCTKTNFIKVKHLGLFIYYDDLKAESNGQGTSRTYLPNIINTKTGSIFELNDKAVKTLLENQPDLLNEYNADKQRKKNFEKYIVEYNKRYKAKLQ